MDVLALPETRQAQIGIPPQSLADRISVCASIAAVGALFERHNLVYLDWSYANVFWSLFDHSAYVIDLDGCSSAASTDPVLQLGGSADAWGENASSESDRNRMALLIPAASRDCARV